MTRNSTFRLPDETLADLDIVATQLGISRTDVICRATADYRAKVTGLVPASSIEAPPSIEASTATEHDLEPSPDVPPPQSAARPMARNPVPHVGPIQSLRSVPVTIPDLPRVHRLENPVTRAREARQGGGGLS